MDLDLGNSASGTTDWVRKSRAKEKDAKSRDKRLAELKQRQLEEEEDELVEQSKSMYSSADLKGLKVMHDADDFQEGRDVILTLADTDILEKDEDGKVIGLNEDDLVLENVQLADKDRRLERENKRRKLNQPVYSALDDYEFQEGVAPGTRASILPQYDKEQKSKAKFELGVGGTASFPGIGSSGNVGGPAATGTGLRQVHSLLQTQATSQVSDFYSMEEYTSFKKSTKKKRKQKDKAYRKKADDSEEMVDEATLLSSATAAESKNEMDIDDAHTNTAKFVKTIPEKIEFKSMDLDEDDPDMALSLARARRLALHKRRKDSSDTNPAAENANTLAPSGVEDRGAVIAQALSIRNSSQTGTTGSRMSGEDEQQQQGGASSSSSSSSTAVNAPLMGFRNDGEEADNIDVDGRRADGTLVFNSTTEFATRLQARLSDTARSKAEAMMRAASASMTAASNINTKSAAAGGGGGAGAAHEPSPSIAQLEDRNDLPTSSGGATESKDREKEDDDEEEIPQQQHQKKSEFAELSDIEDEDDDDDDNDMFGYEGGGGGGGGGNSRKQSRGDAGEEDAEDDEQMAFVHRQPLVAKGMAATLALLQGSGELRKSDELAGRAKDSRLQDPSKNDGNNVKLEYRDEYGRKLTQKEAFRQLSYKFHGYGPSQKKKEKRLKQLEVQNKATSSRAGILEGAGGTMKSLTQAQEATGKAHITIQVYYAMLW